MIEQYLKKKISVVRKMDLGVYIKIRESAGFVADDLINLEITQQFNAYFYERKVGGMEKILYTNPPTLWDFIFRRKQKVVCCITAVDILHLPPVSEECLRINEISIKP